MIDILTGRTERHLCAPDTVGTEGARLHREVLAPFLALRADAAVAGFDLAVDSAFRGFERQLSIWNRKARGELAVLDAAAEPLEIDRLSDRELVHAIMRWSALPGASRHHWGTDIDVFDARARPDGYEIELIPEEVEEGGMFAPLHEWLDDRIRSGRAHGFFRPYDRDRGGVAPERWHISHGPTAAELMDSFSVGTLHATLESADLELRSAVLNELEALWERYVINVQRVPE